MDLQKSLIEVKNSHSELRISSQAVELLWRVLFSSGGSRLAEAGRDLIKRPALGLRHFEIGEDEEQEQQHSEDDKHVGAAQLLWRNIGGETII